MVRLSALRNRSSGERATHRLARILDNQEWIIEVNEKILAGSGPLPGHRIARPGVRLPDSLLAGTGTVHIHAPEIPQ